MKTLSKNKQLFLKIVELVNKQLRNTDQHLSKTEAIALYDKEIAPYGYPSHQSLLIETVSYTHLTLPTKRIV